MSLIYKQQSEIFAFDRLKCLRTAYFHNDCKACMDICPEKAFGFDRNRFTLFEDKCVGCGVCLGVCPTEALSLEFFDPNDYVLNAKDEVVLSCKKDIPCLSVFDIHHYISMLLRSNKVVCDLSHCEGCELNKENKTLVSIQKRIDEAERFLDELGFEKKIENELYEPDRRGFFKSIFKSAQELSKEEGSEVLRTATNKVPVKTTLLKNSLKRSYEEIENPEVSTNYPFLAQKNIDQNCTNCGDCITFCPSDALFSSSDGASIWFIAGKCVDCAICNDLCKPNAIKDEEKIDIIKWIFDRGEELIHHQIEICSECKTPFPYKGGEMICERCRSFVQNYGDIFKLACEDFD